LRHAIFAMLAAKTEEITGFQVFTAKPRTFFCTIRKQVGMIRKIAGELFDALRSFCQGSKLYSIRYNKGCLMSYSATTISRVVDRVNRSYFLPAIQRPYVWEPEQIIALFDSLMKGYPISSFLFWEVKPENRENWDIYQFVEHFRYGQVHNEPAETDGRDVTLVLDGQQRLTSLIIGLRGTYTVIHRRYAAVEHPYYSIQFSRAGGARRFALQPGLKTCWRYRIGAKAHEEVYHSYEAALVRLREMQRPQWRRPNAQGNWGLVTGVSWIKPDSGSS